MHSRAGSAIPGLDSGWISWRMFLFILKEKVLKKSKFSAPLSLKENSPVGAWCSFQDTFFLFVFFFPNAAWAQIWIEEKGTFYLSSYHSTSSTCFLNRNYFYFIFPSFFLTFHQLSTQNILPVVFRLTQGSPSCSLVCLKCFLEHSRTKKKSGRLSSL